MGLSLNRRMRLAISASPKQGGGVPAWVRTGAKWASDYKGQRYWNAVNGVTDFDTNHDFTRSTVAQAFDLSGNVTEFAINAPRVNNRGILLETQASQTAGRSNVPGNAAWVNGDVTVGALVAGFTQVRETAVSSNLHRLFNGTSLAGMTAGQSYSTECIIRAIPGANRRRYMGLRTGLTGTNRNVGFDLDDFAVDFAGTGLAGAIRFLGGDVYGLAYSGVLSTGSSQALSIFTSDVPITSDTLPTFTGDVNKGFDFLNVNQLAGAGSISSPILNATATFPQARGADALVAALPGAGSYGFTVIYDDDSTETFPSVAAGNYSLVTANLDRPQVIYADWGAV